MTGGRLRPVVRALLSVGYTQPLDRGQVLGVHVGQGGRVPGLHARILNPHPGRADARRSRQALGADPRGFEHADPSQVVCAVSTPPAVPVSICMHACMHVSILDIYPSTCR